jgi:hypothetical protein
MTPDQIQQAIQNGIDSYMNQKQFNASKIPSHVHNGTDTVKISAVDIIQNVKYSTFIEEDISETFVITNVFSNMSKISFAGFAANNADGTSATKRAIINGETHFGRCFKFGGSGSSIKVIPQTFNLIQSSNFMYVDSTSLTNNRVGATNDNFLAYALDNTGSVVASLFVQSYTNSSISMTVDLATNWKLQGSLIFT